MKTALILAVIVAGACAATIPPFVCTSNAFVCKFQEIGHNIKYHSIGLGDKLASVGMNILDAVLDTGSDLLIQGSKAVLGTVHEHLANVVGKRDLQLPVDLSDIVQKGKTYLQTIGQSLKDNLKGAIDKLVTISNDMTDLKISDNFEDDIKKIVEGFRGKASTAVALIKAGLENSVKQLISKGAEALGVQKRGISDLLSGAAQALSGALKSVTDALAPHVQTVVGQVTSLGQSIKDQAAALINNVKGSLADLSGKLSGHVSTLLDHGKVLVQHGKDALGAVKDAVSQIAAQTLENAKGSIQGVASTGKDALGVILDHISNGY